MLSGLHLPPHLSFRGIYEGVKQGLRESSSSYCENTNRRYWDNIWVERREGHVCKHQLQLGMLFKQLQLFCLSSTIQIFDQFSVFQFFIWCNQIPATKQPCAMTGCLCRDEIFTVIWDISNNIFVEFCKERLRVIRSNPSLPPMLAPTNTSCQANKLL